MTTTKEQYVAWFLIHNNFIGISFALLEIEIPHFCFKSLYHEIIRIGTLWIQLWNKENSIIKISNWVAY